VSRRHVSAAVPLRPSVVKLLGKGKAAAERMMIQQPVGGRNAMQCETQRRRTWDDVDTDWMDVCLFVWSTSL
jgi:hypothetical protein